MGYMQNTSIAKWTNTTSLEDEINNNFSNNPDFDIHDIKIFAKITPYSYYPIKMAITDTNTVKIDDSTDYIGLELFVGSKNQYLHKSYQLDTDSYKIELDEYFKTAWNPEKFIIFQNGYLMNHGLFSYVIPSFDNTYLKKVIYSTAKFKKNTKIDIYYIESNDNFSPVPISRDVYLGAIKAIAQKNNDQVILIPYPYKDKKSDFLVFDEYGKYLEPDVDFIISYDKLYITLAKPLKLAAVNYIIFSFPTISKTNDYKEISAYDIHLDTGLDILSTITVEFPTTGLDILSTIDVGYPTVNADIFFTIEIGIPPTVVPIRNIQLDIPSTIEIIPGLDVDVTPNDDELDYRGYYFEMYESIYSTNGYINYTNGFTDYNLTKDDFLLFGNSTFIHPSRYTIQDNTSLRMLSIEDQQHSQWAHYSMIIPMNRTAIEQYQSDYIRPHFKVIEIVTTERTTELELPPIDESYESFIIFRNSLILPICDSDKFVFDSMNHKFSIINEEDWIPANTTVTFVFLSSTTNTDSKLFFAQNSFKCTGRYTKIPKSISQTALSHINKTKMFLYLNGTFVVPERYRIVYHNYIVLLDEWIDLSEEHTYTIVYLNEQNAEINMDILSTIDVDVTPDDDELDYSGYYFEMYESIYSTNGYINYTNGFTDYNLTKDDFLLFGNSTFIHPSRYTIQDNTSLKMLSIEDQQHSQWAHYSMIIPMNKEALTTYQSDYIKPHFKVVEIVTTERTNELELPPIEDLYHSFIIFRNSLILPIYDSDRFVLDTINHKFSIINEEDWIPANTTVTFVFLSSTTNTDSKLFFAQNSFKCTGRYTKIPAFIFRKYPGQQFSKTKMFLYLNGTFVVPERYKVHQNYIVLLDEWIDLSEEHTYTIVFIYDALTEATLPIMNADIISHIEVYVPIINMDILSTIDVDVTPDDDELDYSGYYFEMYESIYSTNGYINYTNGFTDYNLTKDDFLLFGNSTFIHPSRYTIQDNTSLRMLSIEDQQHSQWAHYSMIIPMNRTAIEQYQSDYIRPHFKVIEIVTTERTNELELPNLSGTYDSFIIFRNSLILPICDSDKFVFDSMNHKFSIINEEDWIPANTTVTFVFLSSTTNTDSKLFFAQNSFKCTGRYTKIPDAMYRYPGQTFNKAKILLYLNGTFVVPERYRIVYHNYIVLLDEWIDLSEEHTYTVVYLDEVKSSEVNKQSNIIDRSYDENLDDIIIEEVWAKPV